MKVQCIIGKFSENPELCFSRQHMFIPLFVTGEFYEGELQQDTTHILFIDMVENVLLLKDYILSVKASGIKVVAAFFDEARFKTADICINNNLIDKLILFDKQYKNRFSIDTYISDYFLNEYIFPKKSDEITNNVCYFGHNQYDRILPHNITKLIDNTTYTNLYKKVQLFNGVIIYDTGKSECGNKVIHHNKAKALEALMCGVNSYSQEGIKTINYDNFLTKFDKSQDIVPISFTQEDIMILNRKVIAEFINQIRIL